MLQDRKLLPQDKFFGGQFGSSPDDALHDDKEHANDAHAFPA